MKQYTSIIITGVLLILALFFFLFTLLNPKTIEKEIIKVEKQIEYRDTVIEKEVIKEKLIYYTKLDTVRRDSSIYIYITKELSDNIYKDSIEYKLKNDSIELSLKAKSEFKIENDSISRDLKIELNKLKFKYYETNTVITKEVIKSPLISIGTQIGFGGQYGLFHKTLDVGPYFGIGVQLNFRFRK